jgi:lysophospholipase L1-like esterase
LRLLNGLGISCEVDSSLADNMKYYYDDTLPAMYFADIWKGTVVFSSYAAAGLDLGYWANTDSVVRLNGVTGYLANKEFKYTVELVDNGEASALNWSNGSSGAQSTFDIMTGTGTFQTTAGGGNTEKVLIKDISGFTGSFNLSAKNVAIADAMPDGATASNGRLYVEKEVEISAGKGWAANGGLYLGAGADITVSGAFATGSAINTYGDGTVLTLEDGGSVRVNGAITGDNVPTLNFKAGTYQITRNVIETKTVNFCAAAGKYTALDANGNTFTLGANFFSGAGDVYLKTSASGGSFVIQGIPAVYTGTIYVDNSIGLTVSGDLSQMGGKINISDITLLRDSSNIGKIDVCSGATLQIVLTDREAMGGFTPSGVTLLGGTIEYVDLRGTIITTSTESVAYTKPDDYSVPAPEPTAVWVSGQFADEAELHGGYTISTTLAGSINSAGNVVIGDSAYLGAQISLPENTYTKASVLVKFKAPAGGAPAANSVIAGVFDTSEYPIGAISKTVGGTAFEGYYQAKDGTALTTGYNLSSPTISEGEGYMLFSFQSDPTSIQPATGTALYLGDSIANLAGGAWAGLQWRGHTISKLAIGGPAVATPSPWKGLEIESVALFAGEWFSPSDIEFYEFPKAEEPEYEGPDPVAVWVAGEFDDDRSAHGGLEIAFNGNTTNALGQIVIGNSATLGATIAIPDGFDNATMLVKYEIPSGGAPAANSVPASMFVNYDLGACAVSGSYDLVGYFWNTTKNPAVVASGYAFSSSAPSIPREGYLLISVPANSDQNPENHYTAVYVGETVTTLSGGEASGLRFTGPNNRVTSIGIGGPTVAGAVPWEGMVIKSVALFDEWVTTNVIANYKFPEQGAVLPEDSDLYAIEPVAKWVNDFKTTEKNGCTLSVSGTTAAKDDSFGGVLTVGDAAAVIDVTSTNALTVLVKYRAAPDIQSAPVVTFGGQAAVTFDSGICTDTNVARQLSAYYSFIYGNSRRRGIYAVGGNPTLSSDGGYLVCARKTNACLAYVGDSLDNMTGGECTTDMTLSNSTLRKIGIGGQTELSNNDANMVPFTGFVVEKVVVFNGYYTPDQIRYVAIPEDSDTLSIADGKTWNFAAGTTRTYTNIGTLSAGGTIAVTNASELSEGSYMLATWTTAQKRSTGYGHVGTLDVTGLPAGLSAELVYGARAIYLRVWNPTTQAAKGTIKVWPYGDSITEGFNAGKTRANYRVLLAQKLSLLGYNVEMVGCYGKIHEQDGIDPSGQVIPDAWKWHSAKHGATAGPTTSAPKRANLCENVDTLSAQAGNPDVVLLLAGANDIVPATGRSAQQVVASITNIVAHLAVNLPGSKIVVGNQLNVEYGYTSYNYTHVTNMIPQVNALLKTYADNLPEELVGKVFLADLNSYVKSGEDGILYADDHLHPDWWGHDQMAEGWLSIITNQFTSTQTFPSATIPAAPTSAELGAAAKSELVDYRRGFKLARRIDAASNLNTSTPYAATGDGATNNIEKVAYFVEYVRADNNAHKWVWVDMDAFGTMINDVGLPTANHQQVVTKLHVKSNHNGIDDVAADDDSTTGFVEFSPYNYTGNASGVFGAPAGNGDCFDWNDTLSESGSYGCMQVHRVFSPAKAAADGITRGGQVLFAYNNWQSSSSTAEFGIGNFSSHFYRGENDAQTLDYTYTANATKMNASAYSVKRIEIWTKEKATDTDFPTPYSWIDMYFPELVSGWSSAQYNDFATNKNHGSVKNGYAPWESYVLGLDPTDEASKFLATIRMDGTTPIVEFSPTNDMIAIQYILQGKPALTNDWQDVEFDEPGDTNRFFRVRVTW